MKRILKQIIKTVYNNIPLIVIMRRQSLKSIRGILVGYSHSKSFSKSYKYKDMIGGYMPWMTYPFIDYIRNLNLSEKSVFEYGSGYSTVFWASNSRSVVSVENNKNWLKQITLILPSNAKMILRETKETYIKAINETQDKYDVIVLDGYGYRYECAKEGIDKLNEGGMIILDDADNIGYKEICDFLKTSDLTQIEFVGLKPCSTGIRSTSIFIKKGFNFEAKYEVQPKIFVGQQRNYKA